MLKFFRELLDAHMRRKYPPKPKWQVALEVAEKHKEIGRRQALRVAGLPDRPADYTPLGPMGNPMLNNPGYQTNALGQG